MKSRLAIGFILMVLMALACRSTRAVPTSTLHPRPTLLPTDSPSPSPIHPTPQLSPLVTVVTPTPPPTATALPTPSASIPGVQNVRERSTGVLARLNAQNIEPHCLLWRDLDNDDENEWLALYMDTTQLQPALAGLILDGDVVYLLDTGQEIGLGEHATCDVEFHDLTDDSEKEIVVLGQIGAHTQLLHIFHWAEGGYRMIDSFEGDAGVWLQDADADLVPDVIVGQRGPTSDLQIQTVYVWNTGRFIVERKRYAFQVLRRPPAYDLSQPDLAVIYFYLAIGDGDVPGAYGFLTERGQTDRPYDDWLRGFATTRWVEVGQVEILNLGDESASVRARVRAVDNKEGQIVATTYQVTWQTQRQADHWLLDRAELSKLSEQPLLHHRP